MGIEEGNIRLPIDQTLFRAIYHDIRSPLTMYKGYIKLSTQVQEFMNIPTAASEIFGRWEPTVDSWLANLNILQEQSRSYAPTGSEWTRLIVQISVIFKDAPKLRAELEAINMLDEVSGTNEVIVSTTRAIVQLCRLYQAIRDGNYEIFNRVA